MCVTGFPRQRDYASSCETRHQPAPNHVLPDGWSVAHDAQAPHPPDGELQSSLHVPGATCITVRRTSRGQLPAGLPLDRYVFVVAKLPVARGVTATCSHSAQQGTTVGIAVDMAC